MVHFIEVIVFGSLILLSFLLLSNPFKVNTKANRWLGIFTLLWSSFWFKEIVVISTGITIEISKIPAINLVQFMTPIALYLCTKFFTNPNYKFKKGNILYLIAPIAYFTFSILQKTHTYNFQALLISIMFLHALYFISASYICVYKHQKQIKRFASNTIGINLYWLEYIIIVMLVLIILLIVFNIMFFTAPLNTIMNLITLVTIFFVAYNALKQKEIYPVNEQERKDAINASQYEENELTKRKLINDERLVELKAQLHELMLKEEPYLESELNLINLSKMLQISSNHLSYVINSGYNENFYSYINKFRIEKAKELLVDKHTSHLSIIGIAYESGFSSKTSFNTTFKKITGLTPSEFKKRSSDV